MLHLKYMKLKLVAKSTAKASESTVVFLTESDEKSLEALKNKHKEAIKKQDFELKPGKELKLKSEELKYKVIKSADSKNLRNAAAAAISEAKAHHVESLTIDAGDKNLQSIIEGVLLANYEFSSYKKAEKHTLKEVSVIVSKVDKSAKEAKSTAEKVVAGVFKARDLVNMPARDMQPQDLAKTAKDIAKMSENISVKVLNKAQCEKLGMGSYLSVAAGSDTPPAFIHLKYKPKGKAVKKIAIVGKGVTFDSGGLSLKPAQHMMTMKCDMGGSAAVLGLFRTLAELNLNVEVHGIIAATENMVNGKATRPGDVVKAMDGQTIEVLNTDAEGRLTLADALLYAQKQKVDEIIDLATLTGACVVALGEEISALYSDDDQMAKKIIEAGQEAGEEIWNMPLYAKYDDLLKSEIADMRNIAKSSYGGSITAALFLKRFIKGKVKWSHIDIAGPAFAERPLNAYSKYGGTGVGVMTLVNYLKQV